MTKQHTNPKYKAMRNLRSAGKGIFRATGNTAAKGIEKTAKWIATDHTGIVDSSEVIGLMQGLNCHNARMALLIRRTQRSVDNTDKLIRTGIETTSLEHVVGWIVDYLRYLLDLIWGFFKPIAIQLLFAILRLIVIIVFNLVFFFILYLLITS